MGKKLYVGNLTYGVTDSSLQQLFAAHGTVQSAQVIMDRDTGRSKGFGFVEMASDRPGLRFDDPLLSLCISGHPTAETYPEDSMLHVSGDYRRPRASSQDVATPPDVDLGFWGPARTPAKLLLSEASLCHSLRTPATGALAPLCVSFSRL